MDSVLSWVTSTARFAFGLHGVWVLGAYKVRNARCSLSHKPVMGPGQKNCEGKFILESDRDVLAVRAIALQQLGCR